MNATANTAEQAHNSDWMDHAIRAGLIAYGIVLSIAEAATGLRQHELRLANDYNVSVAAFGLIYYAIRGGFAVIIARFPGSDVGSASPRS